MIELSNTGTKPTHMKSAGWVEVPNQDRSFHEFSDMCGRKDLVINLSFDYEKGRDAHDVIWNSKNSAGELYYRYLPDGLKEGKPVQFGKVRVKSVNLSAIAHATLLGNGKGETGKLVDG